MQLTYSMPVDRTPPSVYSPYPAVAGGVWDLPTMSLKGPMSSGSGFWQPWQFRNTYYPGILAGNYPSTRFLGWRTPNMVTLDTGQFINCGRGMFG